MSVDKGGVVTLSCTYPISLIMVEIVWTTPLDIELMSMETNETSITNTLTFTAINSSFAGNYFCSACVGGVAIKNSTAALLTINC